MAVLTPSYSGTCTIEHRNSLAVLYACGLVAVRWKANMTTFSELIDKARNELLMAAVQSDCDIALFIDDDMHWSPAASLSIVKMIQDVCYEGVDVAGTNYPTRGGFPTAKFDDERIRLLDDLPLRRVTRLGTGLMAIDLHFIRDCWPRPEPLWFDSSLSYTENGGFEHYGEDYYFCDQIRARGGQLVARGGIYAGNGNARHPADPTKPVRRPSTGPN